MCSSDLYGGIGSAKDVGKQQWRLLALEKATGKVLFNKLAHEGAPRVKRHTKATHCNSTPATDGKHLVAILARPEERRVGKECRPRWPPYH